MLSPLCVQRRGGVTSAGMEEQNVSGPRGVGSLDSTGFLGWGLCDFWGVWRVGFVDKGGRRLLINGMALGVFEKFRRLWTGTKDILWIHAGS